VEALVFDPDFARRHPCRILIAEDNAINQKVLRGMLRRLGYEPSVVSSGREALAMLQNGVWNVVLMDVQMGDLGGLETTMRIRQELPIEAQPVIIAVTAHTEARMRAEILAAGMNECLTKPIEPQRLTGLLARWQELRA
jgi:CheY-like chemotaxis protein